MIKMKRIASLVLGICLPLAAFAQVQVNVHEAAEG